MIFNVLNATTTTYYPNNRSGDTSLFASDTVGYVDLVENDAALQTNGGRPFESGEYVFVTPPQVYAGLLRDPDFKSSNMFQAPERIWKGEVASLGGFRVIRSNAPGFAPTNQTTAGQSSTVYSSFAIARFAFQVSDLQNLRIYVVAPGGQSDPLNAAASAGNC